VYRKHQNLHLHPLLPDPLSAVNRSLPPDFKHSPRFPPGVASGPPRRPGPARATWGPQVGLAGQMGPFKDAAVLREQASGCEPLPCEADPTGAARGRGEPSGPEEGEAAAPDGWGTRMSSKRRPGWLTALAVGAISPGVNVRPRCHCMPLLARSGVPLRATAPCSAVFVPLPPPHWPCHIAALPSWLLTF